jgi:N-acetylmuramoyl-L-alanine amidase
MIKLDSPYATNIIESPNHDVREGCDVDILILHYTGMIDGPAAQKRLCDREAKVSSHYLVYEDGSITQLVSESRRARHAGVSSWRGITDINSRSIGIEIVNGGHEYECPDFPETQIESLIRLCHDIQSRWAIPQNRILGHSDVAPNRKRDPGEKFPWHRLYASGLGLWVSPSPIVDGPMLKSGETSSTVLELQEMLTEFGYHLALTGTFDAMTRDVITAFQRHFRPQRVDGIADPSTTMTLRHLIQANKEGAR